MVEAEPYNVDATVPDGGEYPLSTEEWLTTDGPRVRDSERVEGELYNPLAKPLHREFAEMELSPEGVLRFAECYGFLGREMETLAEEPGGPFYHGETVTYWLRWASLVRTIYLLWDHAHSPDGDRALSGLVRLEKLDAGLNIRGLRSALGARAVVPMCEVDVSTLRPTQDSLRLRQAALLIAEELVNELLEDGVRPTLALTTREVHLLPHDLLGTIAVLVADEFLGRALPLRRCAGCGLWFKPTRVDQKFNPSLPPRHEIASIATLTRSAFPFATQ